jgi:NADPH:quinone reductase-like Zn-dependent oxidoreductase
VLVKIMSTGICHTDLHAADGDWPVKPTPAFIPGHEGAVLFLDVSIIDRGAGRDVTVNLTDGGQITFTGAGTGAMHNIPDLVAAPAQIHGD